MDDHQRPRRISRVHLKNIVKPNFYNPVPERNNFFFRLKKNTAVLSRIQNEQQFEHKLSYSLDLDKVSRSVEKNSTEQSIEQLKSARSSADHKILSQSKLSKKHIQQSLPKIQSLKKSQSILTRRQAQNTNQISGTSLGSLSTKQILKRYEFKRLKQQLQNKQFLVNHIKNLKPDQIQEEIEQPIILSHALPKLKKMDIKSRNLVDSMSLAENQEKLNELLQNRLSDKDYINYNVKLFEKKDINKKKYFQRYHNILKRQRQEIQQN